MIYFIWSPKSWWHQRIYFGCLIWFVLSLVVMVTASVAHIMEPKPFKSRIFITLQFIKKYLILHWLENIILLTESSNQFWNYKSCFFKKKSIICFDLEKVCEFQYKGGPRLIRFHLVRSPGNFVYIMSKKGDFEIPKVINPDFSTKTVSD